MRLEGVLIFQWLNLIRHNSKIDFKRRKYMNNIFGKLYGILKNAKAENPFSKNEKHNTTQS